MADQNPDTVKRPRIQTDPDQIPNESYKKKGFKKFIENPFRYFFPKKIITPKIQLNIKIGERGNKNQYEIQNVQQLKQILKNKHDIEEKFYYKQFEGRQISMLEELFAQNIKTGLLILIQKNQFIYYFQGKTHEAYIVKYAKENDIKKIILDDLWGKSLYIGQQKNLLLKFFDQNGKITKFQSIKIKYKIVVLKIIRVIVYYYDGVQKTYEFNSQNTILDLKNCVQNDFKLPKDYQIYQIQKKSDNKTQKLVIQNIDQLKPLSDHTENQEILQLVLKNSHILQCYGFHENYLQKYEDYSKVSNKQDAQLIQILQNINFSNNIEEKKFLYSFFSYLFSCLKKRFTISSVIEAVKRHVVNIQQEIIWMPISDIQQIKPIKVNETFLLMYLLVNSEKKLRIEIMSLVKNAMPLPLFLSDFLNIFDPLPRIKLNQQLIWILKQGITLCSIGFHTENILGQKGKSQLLNHIFFTNFCKSSNKHAIVQKIPYIAIQVYDQLFPLNIIDIPHDCDQQVAAKIIDCSDIILINSWRNQTQTQQYTKSILKDNQICLKIFRDYNLDNRTSLKTLKSINLNQKGSLILPNLKNYQDYNQSIDILRQKMNSFLLKLKNKYIRSKRVFNIYNNQQFNELDKITDMFSNNQKINQFAQYTSLINRQKNQKQRNIVQKLEKLPLHDSILVILKFFSKTKLDIDIGLMYFRQRLRILQNQTANKFLIIYQIKSKLQKILQDNQQEYNTYKIKADAYLKELGNFYTENRSLNNKNLGQAIKVLQQMASQFENLIKPQIFSIQLFWRELYSYMKMHPKLLINGNYLNDLVLKLKKKQILSHQPFQIIDGDCLEMSKDIMKKVFESIPDNCLVLTIIGPQSSGKSTLLNFLFGCNFATSQGRCTRGIYGTYFRLNINESLNFNGIFVIDTEGLFAITNETDEKQQDRKNFDSKIVLFCLAISDIVIINVRGNLDHNTQKILSICKYKLTALNLRQDQKPQVVVVLNQNNTSKTDESQNQFKRIRHIFDYNLSKSLPLAYSIKNYDHKIISLLAENQILTKKQPQIQFQDQTKKLLQDIMVKLKRKRKSSKIIELVDKFQLIWTTVVSFPELSEMTTKQSRQLQQEIWAWRKKKDEEINGQLQKIKKQYTQQIINKQSTKAKVDNLGQQYLKNYQSNFIHKIINEDLKNIYEMQKKKINHTNLKNQNDIDKQIKFYEVQKQMNEQKFSGDKRLYLIERQIIKNQNNNTRKYTLQQKKQQFYNAWNKNNQIYQNFWDKKSQIKNSAKFNNFDMQRERILDYYEYYIKNANLHKKQNKQIVGLPKNKVIVQAQQIVCQTNKQLINFQKNTLCNLLTQASQFMVHTQKLHTNILQGSPSDAKLKYLNIRNYFQKKKLQNFIYMAPKSLVQYFKKQYFITKIEEIRGKIRKQKNEEQNLIRNIFQQINDCISFNFGFKIQNFENFKIIYYKKTALSRCIQKMGSYENKSQIQININSNFKYDPSRQIKGDVSQLIKIKGADIFQQNNDFKLRKMNYQIKPKSKIQFSLKEKINWLQIQKNIKKQPFIKQLNKKINSEIYHILNQDLQLLNLVLNNQVNFIKLFQQNNIIQDQQKFRQTFQDMFCRLKILDPQLRISNQVDFLNKFLRLKYFKGKQLQQQVILKQERFNNQRYYLLARYQYQALVANKKQFQGYQKSTKQMKQRFKEEDFKKFIFKEIKQTKKTLDNFLQKILQIIQQMHEKWGRFQSKAISEVFLLVCKEIGQFNNDLNQISHQLNPIIVGQFHHFAINLMWKKDIDLIIKKQKEIFLKKQTSRQAELNRFLIRTSNDRLKIIEDEAEQFIQKIIQGFAQQVKNAKDNLFGYKKRQFNSQINRKDIQIEVDMDIFNINTDPQIILQWLQNPEKFIQKQYEENYRDTLNKVIRQHNKKKFAEQLFDQFSNLLSQLKISLQERDRMNLQTANPFDLFEAITPNLEKTDYDQEGKQILYEYFVDKILGENENKQRKCQDLTLKLKYNYTKIRPVEGILRPILQFLKIKNYKLKITNLLQFIAILSNKTMKSKLMEKLNQIDQITQQQNKNFINMIRVVICKQKCPCCARICGVQQIHTFHKCKYGHQMRALAGNYIQINSERQAYVVRCQMLKPTDIMKYDGNQYTWTQFKDKWANKSVGGWLYDDIVQNLDAQTDRRFKTAWTLAGPIFCKKKQIKYVDYNDAQAQLKKQSILGKAHIIFCLDQSGTMYGKPWEDLKNALKQIMIKLINYSQKAETHVSIITFNLDAILHQERIKPEYIDINNIGYRSGGTNFEPAFTKAYEIADKNITQETVILIFMTDGIAQLPTNNIQNFQTLMNNYPNKFIYNGIVFNSNKKIKVMEDIAIQLKGKNKTASNFNELLQAYTSCLEIIAYSQVQKQNQMRQMRDAY